MVVAAAAPITEAASDEGEGAKEADNYESEVTAER